MRRSGRAARRIAFGIAGALLCLTPALGKAQQTELRLDLVGPRPYAVQPGLGITGALGTYTRVTAAAGYAVAGRADFIDDRWAATALVRFLLDPFRQQQWGLSVGGGLVFRRHAYLAAAVDLEGPAMGGIVPAVQLGVSGGVRAAVVFRRALRGRR